MSKLEERDRRRFENERLKVFSLKVRKIIDGKLKEERKKLKVMEEDVLVEFARNNGMDWKKGETLKSLRGRLLDKLKLDIENEQVLMRLDREDKKIRARDPRKSDWFIHEEEQKKIREPLVEKMKEKVEKMKAGPLKKLAEKNDMERKTGETLDSLRVRLQDKLEDDDMDENELRAHESEFRKLRQENKDKFDISSDPSEAALEAWCNKNLKPEIDPNKLFSSEDAVWDRTVKDEDFRRMWKHPIGYSLRSLTLTSDSDAFGGITLICDSNKQSRPIFSHRMKVYWRNEEWRKSIRAREEPVAEEKTSDYSSSSTLPTGSATFSGRKRKQVTDGSPKTKQQSPKKARAETGGQVDKRKAFKAFRDERKAAVRAELEEKENEMSRREMSHTVVRIIGEEWKKKTEKEKYEYGRKAIAVEQRRAGERARGENVIEMTEHDSTVARIAKCLLCGLLINGEQKLMRHMAGHKTRVEEDMICVYCIFYLIFINIKFASRLGLLDEL